MAATAPMTIGQARQHAAAYGTRLKLGELLGHGHDGQPFYADGQGGVRVGNGELDTEALRQRLHQYHRSLHKSDGNGFGDEGGWMVVHGTKVELGGEARSTYTASLEDVEEHADQLDAKYGDWPAESTEYPTI